MNAEARRRARSAMPQAEQIARPTEWGTPTRPVLVFLPSPERDSKTRRHWLDERCGGGHSPSVSTAVARLIRTRSEERRVGKGGRWRGWKETGDKKLRRTRRRWQLQ